MEMQKYSLQFFKMIQNKKRKLIGPGPILAFSLIALVLIGGLVYYLFYIKPLSEQGYSCVSNEECNDDNPCTVDECSLKTGICYHPKKTCPSGQKCNSATGECELIQKPETTPQGEGEPKTNQTGEDTSEEESQPLPEPPEELSVMDQIEDEIENLL